MEEMLDKGIKLPKDSFADYFDEVYETDCEKFLKIFMPKLNYQNIKMKIKKITQVFERA